MNVRKYGIVLELYATAPLLSEIQEFQRQKAVFFFYYYLNIAPRLLPYVVRVSHTVCLDTLILLTGQIQNVTKNVNPIKP